MQVLKTENTMAERGAKAINEFKIELLATMAFPSLFPDGKGDPTNSTTKRNVTLGENVKHLIRFGERINDKWEYRFASIPDLLIGRSTCCKGTDFLLRAVCILSKTQVTRTYQ